MKKILFTIIIILLLVSLGFISINPSGAVWIKNIKEWIETRDWYGLYESIKQFLSAQLLSPERPAIVDRSTLNFSLLNFTIMSLTIVTLFYFILRQDCSIYANMTLLLNLIIYIVTQNFTGNMVWYDKYTIWMVIIYCLGMGLQYKQLKK